MSPVRQLSLVLRTVAVLDGCALLAVVLPWKWLDFAARSAGVDPGTGTPLLQYLARTGSSMYVLHGATLWFVSFDLPRYAPVVRFLARIAFFHAAIILIIDWSIGMPNAWWLFEVGGYLGESAIILALLRRSKL